MAKQVSHELAECGECGRNKPVCCDAGYRELLDGTIEHDDCLCVDCCGLHGRMGSVGRVAVWDGKCVAGGTYERCE